ncbi:MAG: hypothetical protein QM820_39885 [Minicystis sp.]
MQSEQRSRINTLAQNAFATYPQNERQPFVIIHCFRLLENMQARFHAYSYSWSKDGGWSCAALAMPTSSAVIGAFGSGKLEMEKWQQRWNGTRQGGTSRAVFGAFCDSLDSGADRYTGGAPQLVSIHRSYSAKTYGIIWKGKRFLLGLPSDDAVQYDKAEWRNALFERCDGATMLVLPSAQKHLQPRGLGRSLSVPVVDKVQIDPETGSG